MASGTPPFVRPILTQEAVLVEIRRRIGSGDLQPGDRLVAEKLANELGVSRVPVREALKTLVGEGQVVYERHRGAFVAKLSLAELEQLYRMQELLEAEAIRVAIPIVDDETVQRMRSTLGPIDASNARDDLATWAELNRRFHFELYAAAGLPVLMRAIRQLWDQSDPYCALFASAEEHRTAASEDHRMILAAVMARDVEATVTAQNLHRHRALEALRSILTDQPLDGSGNLEALGAADNDIG